MVRELVLHFYDSPSTCNDYSEWRPYYINPVYCMISWDLLRHARYTVVSGALLKVRITELKLTEWKTVK